MLFAVEFRSVAAVIWVVGRAGGNAVKASRPSHKNKEPSGAAKGAGGFLLGRLFRSRALSIHKNASVVASSNTASSTRCALRAAASRSAVIASLFTLRGIPLVA